MVYENTKNNVEEIYKEYLENNNDTASKEVRKKYDNFEYAMEEYTSALVEDSIKCGIKYALEVTKERKTSKKIDELLNELVMSEEEVREVVEDEMQEIGKKEMCELYQIIIGAMDEKVISNLKRCSEFDKMLIIGKEIYRFGFGKAILLVNDSMKMHEEEQTNVGL